jgi:DMSO/TMAO reductase YedYZ heme-binding membrane subunit
MNMDAWMAWTNWLSTWGVIKAAGMTSYMLMFISVVLGAFSYGAAIPPKAKKWLLPIHQSTGWFGFLFGLLHGAVLIIDGYRPFLPSEVLVPFASGFHPVTLGLGTLALYIMAAILISSDIIRRLGKKIWKSIHLLSYPMFLFLLIHGAMDGSDAEKPWAFLMYACSAFIFAAVLLIRMYIQWKKGGQVEGFARGR